MSKTAIAEKELTETGTKIASEAVDNIRTVASLSMPLNRIEIRIKCVKLKFNLN